MGLFTKSPEAQEQKILQKEEKAEAASVKQALKDLERAHKAEQKAIKAEHDAAEDQQKAYRREEKLAAELNKLKHEHEAAVTKKQGADNEFELRKSERVRLEGETAAAKDRLEEMQNKYDQNTAVRDERIHALSVAQLSTNSSTSSLGRSASKRQVSGGSNFSGAGSPGAATTPPPMPEGAGATVAAAGVGGAAGLGASHVAGHNEHAQPVAAQNFAQSPVAASPATGGGSLAQGVPQQQQQFVQQPQQQFAQQPQQQFAQQPQQQHFAQQPQLSQQPQQQYVQQPQAVQTEHAQAAATQQTPGAFPAPPRHASVPPATTEQAQVMSGMQGVDQGVAGLNIQQQAPQLPPR